MEQLKKKETFGVKTEIIDSFYQQWENFPEFAALIRKDRRVIALNKAARDIGYPQGIKCFELGGRELHKECLADTALKEQKAKYQILKNNMIGPQLTMITYWLPLHKEKDLYVHFNIDITRYADPEKIDGLDSVLPITSWKLLQFTSNLFFKFFAKRRHRE